jgi:hypothetical protein
MNGVEGKFKNGTLRHQPQGEDPRVTSTRRAPKFILGAHVRATRLRLAWVHFGGDFLKSFQNVLNVVSTIFAG